ncbi:NAD-dependent epimerase/dehydratase family protein [Paenibacillus filicis]|uniref:NAD-dependent epimerase/dehydratase family protein n=1 Tax=Paenibacillus gyeongsangnamensis TaxID=3388067 RepID=A0ABT4Q426_9BACL|nr:NAD-dependent epimerase/dehydratase family protein [Paenibacillus filicis]MCZ8511591.1 NAD-dependent epimerase/dehydratase family protein [Paenibacillus filicis]
MRYIVIGGSGHIGTYLVPALVRLGHEVIEVSRGERQPYRPDPAWNEVRRVPLDRDKAEADGSFGQRIRELQGDVIIDLICFTLESAQQVTEALEGEVHHYLSCGTIWVHGPSVTVPVTEEQPRRPFGDYGIRKAKIEAYLLDKARKGRFPATVLHPGHIVGPGWVPLNPAGHFNPDVFARLAAGKEISIPNLGMETVHHVHAEDVAQAFIKASQCWSQAVGHSFHVVSPAAVSLRGYAETAASWFGHEAVLRFEPFESMKHSLGNGEARTVYDHIAHSPSCSIEKARRLLGYEPRYSSMEAVRESVNWLIEQKKIDVS